MVKVALMPRCFAFGKASKHRPQIELIQPDPSRLAFRPHLRVRNA